MDHRLTEEGEGTTWSGEDTTGSAADNCLGEDNPGTAHNARDDGDCDAAVRGPPDGIGRLELQVARRQSQCQRHAVHNDDAAKEHHKLEIESNRPRVLLRDRDDGTAPLAPRDRSGFP